MALDLDRSRRPRPNTVDPWARAGRSGQRPRLWHDGAVGGTAGVRPHGLASRRHPGGVRGRWVGQRVCGPGAWRRAGPLGEYVAVEPRTLAPSRGGVDFRVGATLPIS